MTTETATIQVPRIRDQEGNPTCRWFDAVCPFFMTSSFGTREHCYFGDRTYKGTPADLLRRENGMGTLIPCQQCQVWDQGETGE